MLMFLYTLFFYWKENIYLLFKKMQCTYKQTINEFKYSYI